MPEKMNSNQFPKAFTIEDNNYLKSKSNKVKTNRTRIPRPEAYK